MKLYLISKDCMVRTHRHDVLDKVFLPVLLPGAGHQVVVHLDDAPARHQLGAQCRYESPVDGGGARRVTVPVAVQTLRLDGGGGGGAWRGRLGARGTRVGIIFGCGARL